MKLWTTFLIMLILFFSCNKQNNPIYELPSLSKGMIVLNEGLYSQNNSSITFYDFETEQVVQDAFADANNGENLGDTANDLKLLNDNIYVVVDNSNKVQLIQKNNFKSKGMIDLGSGSSPREIALVDQKIGYVTSAILNKIFKVDLENLNILKEINVGSRPEGQIIVGKKLYVANSGFGYGNTVSILDIKTDDIIKELNVGFNPRFFLKDKNNFIYLVCSGLWDMEGRGGIYKIDPITNTVIDSLIIFKNPQKFCLFKNNKVLIINGDGLNSVSLSPFKLDSLLISGMKVNTQMGYIYSITYDESRDQILCGNPKSFTQNGEIVIYNSQVEEIKRIPCGLNPGVITIKEN